MDRTEKGRYSSRPNPELNWCPACATSKVQNTGAVPLLCQADVSLDICISERDIIGEIDSSALGRLVQENAHFVHSSYRKKLV